MVEFFTIKTRVLVPPKDDLFPILEGSITDLFDGDILLIASKILAIHQGRCIKKSEVNKLDLIEQEADVIPGRLADPCITIKDRIFIPNSGIDASNGGEYYILWPENISDLLKEIHLNLCQRFRLKNLGILSVDSRVLPMRAGTVGISQGSFGFKAVYNCVGKSDLFGRELKISQINIADCIAGMAPVLMGEGDECCPLVIARGIRGVNFCSEAGALSIPDEQDLFYEFLKNK